MLQSSKISHCFSCFPLFYWMGLFPDDSWRSVCINISHCKIVKKCVLLLKLGRHMRLSVKYMTSKWVSKRITWYDWRILSIVGHYEKWLEGDGILFFFFYIWVFLYFMIFCQIMAESCQHWHTMGRNHWMSMLAEFCQDLAENYEI